MNTNQSKVTGITKHERNFVKENIILDYKELIKQLNKKLIGLYNYYGISGNYYWLYKLYNYVKRLLRKWLSRRSQRGKVSWNKMNRIVEYCPLVKPRITYPLW